MPAAERGKLIFSENFSGSVLASGWNGKPGAWEVANGAVKISEKAEDKHAAVRRHPLKYRDAMFEFSFQFDGAKMIALSLNNKDGHVCRLSINPRGMVLQTDKPNQKSDVKPERLASLNTAVEEGKWHNVVVQVQGRSFPVSGVCALLKTVRVYELKP